MKTIQTNVNQLLTVALIVAALPALAPVTAAPLYRPQQDRREINTDEYQLSVQKNSQIDLRTTNGDPIVDNAFPSITFADGTRRPLKVDYRQSERVSVRNALGQGNGFLFKSPEAEWLIATYPTQPFLTVDLTYINASKKPVQVAGLSPFGIGEDAEGAVHLGPGREQIRLLQPPAAGESWATIVPESETSPGHLGAFNPASGRVLVAGFISHRSAPGFIRLSRSTENTGDHFDRFASEMAFFAPRPVGPGERLQTDTFYIAIVEHDPQEALERFVRASQRFEPYPGNGALHGWVPAAGVVGTPDLFLDNLSVVDRALRPFGWTNQHLGTAWAAEGAPYQVGAAFSDGLEDNVRIAHENGLSTGLQAPAPVGDTTPFLDFAKRCRDWGVNTVELTPEVPPWGADASSIHPRQLFEALEKESITQPSVVYTRAAAPGSSLRDWALASRQYYLPPVGNPLLAGESRVVVQDTSSFTDDQFITAWTLAAMQGALLRPTTPYTELSPLRRHILSRLLPAPTAPGRPLDLFQDGPPRQWVLPLKTKAGDWTIVALFNWDSAAAAELETPLARFGLNDQNRYTVYDFWASRYLGLIEHRLRAEVPAEGVRLFGLRRYENVPMLVASDRHYTQGASDHIALAWSYADQALSGTFDGVEKAAYTLTVLLPEPYALKSIDATAPVTEQRVEGNVLTFSIQTDRAGAIRWSVACTYGAAR